MSDVSQLSDAQLMAALGQPSSTGNGASSLPTQDIRVNPDGTYTAPDGTIWEGTDQAHAKAVGNLQNWSDAALLQHLQPDAHKGDAAYDALHSLGTAGEYALAGVAGGPGDLIDTAYRGLDWLGQKLGDKPAKPDTAANYGLPTTPEIMRNTADQIGVYEPQTALGRGIVTAGQFAPAALFPAESAGVAASRVAVPALASEGAGEVARSVDPQHEGTWRAVGGLVGGGMQGGGEAILNAPKTLAARSMTGVSQADLAAAQARMTDAASHGVQLTMPEAMAQSGNSSLLPLQHYVENSYRGRPQTAPFFAQRPAQVSDAVTAMADALSPATDNPGMLGQRAQQAAEGAQFEANQARKAASDPFYKKADPEGVDGAALADMLSRLGGDVQADKTGLIAPRLAQFGGDLTDDEGLIHTDIGSLSTVRNHWRDLIDLPPVGVDPLSKQQAGAIGGYIGQLTDLLKHNPNFAAGDAAYADASRNIVDPINQGPVGTIAKTDAVPAQTGALFRPTSVGGAAETQAAIPTLEAQDQGLTSALAGQYLRDRAFATGGALRDLQPGPNEWGGARYAVDVAGAPEQRAALLGGVGAAAGPDAASRLDGLIEALQATGRRMQPGSRTAFNQEAGQAFAMSPMLTRGLKGALDFADYGGAIDRFAKGQLYKRSVDALADALTNGDPTAQADFFASARRGPQTNAVPLMLLDARAGGSQ